MLCCAVLVRTDVSEELSASIIRATRIGELGTLDYSRDRIAYIIMERISEVGTTLIMEAICSYETSEQRTGNNVNRICQFLVIANDVPGSLILYFLLMKAVSSFGTKAQEGIPHSHGRENLKSYIALTGWAL
jgi:hypothetical protein